MWNQSCCSQCRWTSWNYYRSCFHLYCAQLDFYRATHKNNTSNQTKLNRKRYENRSVVSLCHRAAAIFSFLNETLIVGFCLFTNVSTKRTHITVKLIIERSKNSINKQILLSGNVYIGKLLPISIEQRNNSVWIMFYFDCFYFKAVYFHLPFVYVFRSKTVPNV